MADGLNNDMVLMADGLNNDIDLCKSLTSSQYSKDNTQTKNYTLFLMTYLDKRYITS